MRYIILFLIYFGVSESKLWSKGVVHYSINPKDYDLHSQDEIVSTFSALEKEICVKFFNTPFNYNSSDTQGVLYISNPNKQKNCPPQLYNYTGSVVNMTIGYKCINKDDIARMTMEMLKASIDPKTSPINSYDLLKRFEEQCLNRPRGRVGGFPWIFPRPLSTLRTPIALLGPAYKATVRFKKSQDQAKPRPTYLTTDDRNFINTHYHSECSTLSQRAYDTSARRSDFYALSVENRKWFKSKNWPYGVVTYSVDETLRDHASYYSLKAAMTQIELTSCVLFHEAREQTAIYPKNLLVFKLNGADEPELGYKEGEQVISLGSMINGDPGHTAHALNNLMRVLGIPMMSNRYDRDNYIKIHWWYVLKGKERLLEKTPKEAWITGLPYDFSSVTHAPANYLCEDCPPGRNTVEPLQDVLWSRLRHMGHYTKLSEGDSILLNLAYEDACKARKESSVQY